MDDPRTGPAPLRIEFVPGVTPGKWLRTWAQRMPDHPLEATLVDDDAQLTGLRGGTADLAFVRLPVDRDGLHLIPLYREVPVVVVSVDHVVSAVDEVTLADLADEVLLQDPGTVPGWQSVSRRAPVALPEMTTKQAVEAVAAGSGVLVVPMSVARLYHRKDVTFRPVLDLPETEVGVAWRAGEDDPRIEEFIGIVRGRTARSSRGTGGADASGAAPAKGRPGTRGRSPQPGRTPPRRGSARSRPSRRRGR